MKTKQQPKDRNEGKQKLFDWYKNNLKGRVQKNIAFNNQELSEDIRILNTDSVGSFKEITDRYADKVIFIGIWATWCGPCCESFATICERE